MFFSLKSIAPLAFLLTSVLSAPIELETRQSATTCGSVSYTSAETAACQNAAFSYYTKGSSAGSSTYPHQYNDYEGFSFPVAGPYQEFPLKASVYTGGSPGADRCIINTSGLYAGAITHSGASGNNFVGCSGTS